MIELPTILYKDGGPYQRKGGTFSTVAIDTMEGYNSAIAAGMVAHPDLIGKAQAAAPDIRDDSVPPTREEMEQKGHELGLKFDGRTSDRKLLAMITAAIKE